MSAFLCSDRHLKVLALAALTRQHGPRPTSSDLQSALDELFDANNAAVVERYGAKAAGERPVWTSDDAFDPAHRVSPVQIIKAVACFEYQCSEWDGYEDSAARELARAAEVNAHLQLPGYEAAAWELP